MWEASQIAVAKQRKIKVPVKTHAKKITMTNLLPVSQWVLM